MRLLKKLGIANRSNIFVQPKYTRLPSVPLVQKVDSNELPASPHRNDISDVKKSVSKTMRHRVDVIKLQLRGMTLAELNCRIESQNLRGLDLSGLYCLKGRDLSNIDASGTNFKNSNLQNCNFIGSKLERSNFNHSKLKGSNFSHAYLSHAKFNNAKASECIFKNAKFLMSKESDLPDHIPIGASFRCTDLKNSNFDNAVLYRSWFGGAKLNQANFSSANVENAAFSQRMDHINEFYGSDKEPHAPYYHCFSRTDLRGTTFNEINPFYIDRHLDTPDTRKAFDLPIENGMDFSNVIIDENTTLSYNEKLLYKIMGDKKLRTQYLNHSEFDFLTDNVCCKSSIFLNIQAIPSRFDKVKVKLMDQVALSILNAHHPEKKDTDMVAELFNSLRNSLCAEAAYSSSERTDNENIRKLMDLVQERALDADIISPPCKSGKSHSRKNYTLLP